MRLVNYELETPIEWEAAGVWVLAVESPRQFQRTVSQLYAQCHGETGPWVAEHAGKALNWAKESLLWLDFCNMADTEKKLQTKLWERLQHNAYEEDLYMETHRVLAELEQYTAQLADTVDWEVSFSSPDLGALFKAVGVRWVDTDDLQERLVQYVNAISAISNIRLLVVVGLYAYLPETQLAPFWRHCSMHDLCVLSIEPREPARLGDETILVIDKDLCEYFAK